MLDTLSQLEGEYAANLAQMKIVRQSLIDAVTRKLIRLVDQGHYHEVSDETGVPEIFIAASFEREAASNFSLSPAQGDPWDKPSVHVPAGRGPFHDWQSTAIDAYRLVGLDKIGAANWTWLLACYYGERFNGFGYRDLHHMRTPYLWAGSNLQQRGKYTSDHGFDPEQMDIQPGIIPVMMRMAQLSPALNLPDKWPFPPSDTPISIPQAGVTPSGAVDGAALQQALNNAGYGPLKVDGSIGRITEAALRKFQKDHGLVCDGIVGRMTASALELKIA